jgi:agmatinase
MNKIIIQGIQFDEKSSYQKGPKLAPPLIREALNCGSANMFAENLTSIENSKIEDKGDFEISNYFDIEKITKTHLDSGAKVFTLGGDHSITFPIIKAHFEKYPKLDILHIDAHCDLYDNFEGDPYSHACPFARIMENGLAVKLVQVGIRTLNTHQAEQAEKFNVEIHQMKNLDLSTIPKFKNPLYISLDMDGFDPAFAPGVSHHEPGGLTSRQVIDLIQSIETEVIGADIVEYNPDRDFQNMTAFLAAKMMKEIVAKMM